MSRNRIFSLCLDVGGFLRNEPFPSAYTGMLRSRNGQSLSPEEAATYLVLQRARGRKVIPTSAECSNPCRHAASGCTGFDYSGGGCPGRETPGEQPS